MKTLLRIDSSSRREDSYSRMLSSYFTEKWLAAHPGGKVIYRDLAEQPIPHIEANTIRGFYAGSNQMNEELAEATKLSDVLIEELSSADELLISSPLYNLNVPSNLKAYLDQVVRIGKTFTSDEQGYRGLLPRLKAYLITVKGGVVKGTPYEKFDFQDPYLKAILDYMGIELREHFCLEGTANEKLINQNYASVKQSILNHFNPKNN